MQELKNICSLIQEVLRLAKTSTNYCYSGGQLSAKTRYGSSRTHFCMIWTRYIEQSCLFGSTVGGSSRCKITRLNFKPKNVSFVDRKWHDCLIETSSVSPSALLFVLCVPFMPLRFVLLQSAWVGLSLSLSDLFHSNKGLQELKWRQSRLVSPSPLAVIKHFPKTHCHIARPPCSPLFRYCSKTKELPGLGGVQSRPSNSKDVQGLHRENVSFLY